MVSRIVWLAGFSICASGLLHAQGRGPELPAGDGKDLAQKVCATACHDATAILMKRDGANGWRKNAERMVVQKGAQVTPEDLETIIRYLATRLGPGTGLMQTGVLPPGALGGGAATAQDVRLPDGPGKEVVEMRCAMCHDLGRVVSTRRSQRDWERLTRDMMGRLLQANPAQTDTIITYFTTHFRKEAE